MGGLWGERARKVRNSGVQSHGAEQQAFRESAREPALQSVCQKKTRR